MKLSLKSLVPLMALLAIGGTSEQARSRELPIWVIGDSIGVGVAAALRRAGLHIEAEPMNGTTARRWLGWLRARRTWPTGPRFVVVSLGTNDAQSKELRYEFAANAVAIVEELQRRGHRVCWLLPPSKASLVPSSLDLERLVASGAAVIQEREVPMGDAWHPTAAGYDELAAVVRRVSMR